MKKILIALAITGLAYSGAEAQTAPLITCAAPKGKVCRRSDNHTYCYKTKYAEDFKVCKNDNGYFICCETPNKYNSTHPYGNMVAVNNTNNFPLNPMETKDEANAADLYVNMVAPQSQSYPAMNSASSYEGYYYNSGRHYIKVCYGGDNVAELNKAAYNGCPTPAYDGPEANRARNVNVSNPDESYPQPPISGRRE